MTDPRRGLPSVTAVLEIAAVRELLAHSPRALVVDAIRYAVDGVRSGTADLPADDQSWAVAVSAALRDRELPSLTRVINATGVVLHTNLGRAPLSAAAIDAIARVASGFSNLEYDLASGQRGSRYTHCASLICELTGAEAALVVNNCAAALVLLLDTLANGREAIVSRGELVEIGGSFRVPDIMTKSGARLVEVGTTNRTHLSDYQRALSQDTGAIVKVHRSNFAVEGFVAEVSTADLARLAVEHGVPLVHDLGSGLLLSLDEFGLRGEPTAREVLAAGASAITMSGDKLLGGPQAGIIAGKADIIDAVKRNPLTRAFRVDKLTLAALEATLAVYRDPARAISEIPTLAMLTAPVDSLRARAQAIRARVGNAAEAVDVKVVDSEASVGGGAFPTTRIPSAALSVGGDATHIESNLRSGHPPVITRVANGRVHIDVRTVHPSEDDLVAAALTAALA